MSRRNVYLLIISVLLVGLLTAAVIHREVFKRSYQLHGYVVTVDRTQSSIQSYDLQSGTICTQTQEWLTQRLQQAGSTSPMLLSTYGAEPTFAGDMTVHGNVVGTENELYFVATPMGEKKPYLWRLADGEISLMYPHAVKENTRLLSSDNLLVFDISARTVLLDTHTGEIIDEWMGYDPVWLEPGVRIAYISMRYDDTREALCVFDLASGETELIDNTHAYNEIQGYSSENQVLFATYCEETGITTTFVDGFYYLEDSEFLSLERYSRRMWWFGWDAVLQYPFNPLTPDPNKYAFWVP